MVCFPCLNHINLLHTLQFHQSICILVLTSYFTNKHYLIVSKELGVELTYEKLKLKSDRNPLEIIYAAFIRPILEYGDVIWDNCDQYEKNEIEKILLEAARIATGTMK